MGIDITTALFLVFSGMIVGALACYRNRTDDQAAQSDLNRHNEQLRSSLVTLEQSHARQTGQLQTLKQLCDDWSANRDTAQREHERLQQQHDLQTQQLHQSQTELREQRELATRSQDQMHLQTRQQIEQQTASESDWLRKNAILEQRVAEYESRIAGFNSDANRVKQELIDARSQIEELGSLAPAEDSAARADADQAITRLVELQKLYDALKQETVTLREELADYHLLQQHAQQLNETVDSLEKRVGDVTDERDAGSNREKSLETVSRGLQKRIDNQESTIHLLREKHNEALDNLRHELQQRTDLESRQEEKIAALQEDFLKQKADLQQQLDSATPVVSADVDALNEQLNSLQNQASEYTHSIVEMDRVRAELEKNLADSQQRLVQQQKQDSETIGELQGERDRLAGELDSQGKQNAKLQQQIDELETTVGTASRYGEDLAIARTQVRELESFHTRFASDEKQLRAESAELKRLRIDYQRAHERQQQLRKQLDELRAVETGQQAIHERYQTQISELESQLAQQAEIVEQLRSQRGVMMSELAEARLQASDDSHVISFTAGESLNFENEYGGRTRRDDRRGIVFTQAPKRFDDLKRISGIAGVLEKRLNDFGIYTFRQIIEWEPEAIEEFSRLLAFRDRIVRDDWQGQARAFYEQSCSEEVLNVA